MRASHIALFAIAAATACAHAPRPSPTIVAAVVRPALRPPPPSDPATQPSGDPEELRAPCGEGQVFFTTASSVLDDGARRVLDTYATCLARYEIDVVYVWGMTDPVGTVEANLVLGGDRARAVADYLHSVGCCAADFEVHTWGEGHGTNASETLWPSERSASATGVSGEE